MSTTETLDRVNQRIRSGLRKQDPSSNCEGEKGLHEKRKS